LILLTILCTLFFGYLYIKNHIVFPLYRCSEAARAFTAGDYAVRIQDTFSDTEANRVKFYLNTLFKAAFAKGDEAPDILLPVKYRQIILFIKEKGIAVATKDISKKFKLTPTQCKAQLSYLSSKGYIRKADSASYVFLASFLSK
jgi:hypothetical protein